MDLTTSLNVVMWVTGLAAMGFSLHLIWMILRNRSHAWSASMAGDNAAIHASVKRLEAAFADIDKIERRLRRDGAVGDVELAVAVAALKRLKKISRVTLAGSEVRVEFDREAKADRGRIEETLSGLR